MKNSSFKIQLTLIFPLFIMLAILPWLSSQGLTAGKGDHHHHDHGKHKHQAHTIDGGEPGKLSEVTRTIKIIASDEMKFSLTSIKVKDGETIRFVLVNQGELAHDFTIGTPAIQKAHQKEMSKMMENMNEEDGHKMEHNDPNALFLQPGETKELIWKFKQTAMLEFGCNVPGHYQAGMKGEISFRK